MDTSYKLEQYQTINSSVSSSACLEGRRWSIVFVFIDGFGYNNIIMANLKKKEQRRAYWESLTLDEQADYAYDKMIATRGRADYQYIYSVLYSRGEFMR